MSKCPLRDLAPTPVAGPMRAISCLRVVSTGPSAALALLCACQPALAADAAGPAAGKVTVYRCLDGSGLPWLAPVGRLDKASEGLLLFSNDPEWAARVLDPQHGPDKTYHVQVDRVPDAALLAALCEGVVEEGERLRAKSVVLLRSGTRNAWLEIVLDEGRNRQIRRLLAAFDVGVLRLVRVAIGELQLGTLGKGQWRELDADERDALAPASTG